MKEELFRQLLELTSELPQAGIELPPQEWSTFLRNSISLNNPNALEQMSRSQKIQYVRSVHQNFTNRQKTQQIDALQIDFGNITQPAVIENPVFQITNQELYSADEFEFATHIAPENRQAREMVVNPSPVVYAAPVPMNVPQMSPVFFQDQMTPFSRLDYFQGMYSQTLKALVNQSFAFAQPNIHFPFNNLVTQVGNLHKIWVSAYETMVHSDTAENSYDIVSAYKLNMFKQRVGYIGECDIDNMCGMIGVWALAESSTQRNNVKPYPISMDQLFSQAKNMIALGVIQNSPTQSDYMREFPVIRDVAYAMLRDAENHRCTALFMQAYRSMLHRQNNVHFDDYEQTYALSGQQDLANKLDDQACAFIARYMLIQAVLRYPILLLDVFTQPQEYDSLCEIAALVKNDIQTLIMYSNASGIISEQSNWMANTTPLLLQDFPAQPLEYTHSQTENLLYDHLHQSAHLMLLVSGMMPLFNPIGPITHVQSLNIVAPYFRMLTKMGDFNDKVEIPSIIPSMIPRMFSKQQIKATRSVVLEGLRAERISRSLVMMENDPYSQFLFNQKQHRWDPTHS